jgi:hypothetical protein
LSVVLRGTGGPQAMLSTRDLTRSKRRECCRVSWATESKRTEPSSQPIARVFDAGFAEMHQMAPPCEFIVLYFPIRTIRFRVQWKRYLDTGMVHIPFYELTSSSGAEES